MEVTDGGLSFGFSFDISDGKKNLEEVVSLFQKLGYSAEESGELADEFAKEFTDALMEIVKGSSDASDAVSKMRQKCKELEDSASAMGEGLEKVKIEAMAEGFEAAGNVIEEDSEKFDMLKKNAEGSTEAFSGARTAVQALSASLKTMVIGLAIQALKELVELTWQFASGALEAERAAARWSVTMESFVFNIDEMRDTASNVEDIIKAYGKTREEIRAYRIEQAKLREEEARSNYNAMTKSLAEDDRNVSEEDYKKAGDMYIKAVKERKKIQHENLLDEIQEQKEQKEIDHNAYMEQLNAQSAEIELMKDGYEKRAREIKIGREKERSALQHILNTAEPGSMLESQERDIREQIRLSMEAEKKELSDLYMERNAAVVKAEESLSRAEYDAVQKRIDWKNKLRQNDIDLMEEGNAKELAQMKLDHATRLVEIEREAKEERDAMSKENMDKWINEQTKKGRVVTEKDWYASNAYKSLYGGLTEDQRKQIEERRLSSVEHENALAAKIERDYIAQMLIDYGNYASKKEAIDRSYTEARKALESQLTKSLSEEEKKRIQDAIAQSGKMQSRDTLNLDLDIIDATAYETVEDRINDINEAYKQYYLNLEKASASAVEMNEALREQHRLTGKMATLSEKIRQDKEEVTLAAERGDVDLVKALNEELRKLKKELEDIKTTSDKKSIGTKFKEWAQELKASDILGTFGDLGDVLAEIGEAAGNDSIASFGDSLSKMGGIAAKIAGGDYLGAALQVITEIGMAIAEDTAKVNEFRQANEQAAVDADLLRIAMAMDVDGSIFGSNAVAQLAGYIKALDMASKGVEKFRKENSDATYLNTDSGMSFKLGDSKMFKVLDRNAFGELFGGGDKYMDLASFAEKNNLELYDAYGNLNTDVLELFKKTYEDLSEEDRQWVDNAIKYSEEYADAMAGIASYMESLFGDTVDTIVDQMFEGSLDIQSITSDLGEKMAKDLMKAAIMSEYFGSLKEDIQKALEDEGGLTDKSAAEIYGFFVDAMNHFNNDLPQWQELMERYRQTFGFGGDEMGGYAGGNLLKTATQDSVDLVNGQMNAIRMNQIRIADAIDSVLISISGLREDMNRGFGESVNLLRGIENNTGNTNNSVLRGFGLQ